MLSDIIVEDTLLVSLAAMPDGVDFNDVPRIIHRINYAVVTDTNAPAMLRADEFATASRARLANQNSKRLKNATSYHLI
jgi:hypothetical protein